LDSSSTMVEVTSAYATHFIDMYVDKHTGKHMTGERVRILLLTLPFLLRDLIAPEVCSTWFWFDIFMIIHDIMIYIMSYIVYDMLVTGQICQCSNWFCRTRITAV
jgi:hypothetical protein